MPVLFVYGTLQHPLLLERLLGHAPEARAATVNGWRAARLRGRVYPGLVPEDGGVAGGCLVEVRHDELDVLDRFEGEQYERIVLTATAEAGWPKGRDVEAHAWRLRAELSHLALDDDWDLDEFAARHLDAFLGGSRAGDEHPRDQPDA